MNRFRVRHTRNEPRRTQRECVELSKAIGASFGLPIDMSSKMGGVRAICSALNEGDVARAQIATVLLAIPDLPDLSKDACSPADMKKFVDELHWSGLIKADWDPDEHPRWPAGAPDSQGGEFAPKGDDAGAGQTDAAAPRSSRDTRPDVAMSPRQRFNGADVPSNILPKLQADSEGMESLLGDGGSRRRMSPKISVFMQAMAAISAMCRWPAPPRSLWMG